MRLREDQSPRRSVLCIHHKQRQIAKGTHGQRISKSEIRMSGCWITQIPRTTTSTANTDIKNLQNRKQSLRTDLELTRNDESLVYLHGQRGAELERVH